jgi:hypothetical protein
VLAASTEGLQFTFFANKESGKMEGIEKDSVSRLSFIRDLARNGLELTTFIPFLLFPVIS